MTVPIAINVSQQQYAHRISYEIQFGPVPDGLDVLHRCNNTWCVNPIHLYAGTPKENTADMIRAGRARGWPHGLPTWQGDKRLTINEARALVEK